MGTKAKDSLHIGRCMSAIHHADRQVEVQSEEHGTHVIEVTLDHESLADAEMVAKEAFRAHVVWNWNKLLHRSLRDQAKDAEKLNWVQFLPMDDEVPLTRLAPHHYLYRFYVCPERIKAAKTALAQDNFMKVMAGVVAAEQQA
jgi:hypothetical protein